MAPFIGIGNRVGSSKGQSWSAYWATLTPMPLLAYSTSETTIALSVTDVFSGGAKLAWYKSIDGSTYTKFSTTAKGILTTNATGLIAGTLYYFKVRAEAGSNYSHWSNIASTPTWVSEYTAVYNAVSGDKPGPQTSDAQNYFIWYQQGNNSDLRDTWSKYACIIPFFGGMSNSSDALIWWNNPSRKGTFSGSPTYTNKLGFTGDGFSYINSKFNPSIDGGGVYTQNSNSNGHWFMNARLSSAVTGSGIYVGTNGLGVLPTVSSATRFRAGGAQIAYSNERVNNKFTAVRTSSTKCDCYLDKTKVVDQVTNNSVALPNYEAYILAVNVDGTATYHQTDTIGLVYYGSTLDQTDINIIVDACEALVQKLAVYEDETCDGETINTSFWTITHPNPTQVVFSQNYGLKMDEQRNTAPLTFLANNAKSLTTQTWGRWEFDCLSIGRASNAQKYTAFGLFKDINNFAMVYRTDVDPWDMWIYSLIIDGREQNTPSGVEVGTGGLWKLRFKITLTNDIMLYKLANDEWVQIGATKKTWDVISSYKAIGALNVGMSTTSQNIALSMIRDVKINGAW